MYTYCVSNVAYLLNKNNNIIISKLIWFKCVRGTGVLFYLRLYYPWRMYGYKNCGLKVDSCTKLKTG